MSKKYLIYLRDINTSIKNINKFIQGMSLDQFISDDKTSSAVIRKF